MNNHMINTSEWSADSPNDNPSENANDADDWGDVLSGFSV
jgi:hypothetical protein